MRLVFKVEKREIDL